MKLLVHDRDSPEVFLYDCKSKAFELIVQTEDDKRVLEFLSSVIPPAPEDLLRRQEAKREKGKLYLGLKLQRAGRQASRFFIRT